MQIAVHDACLMDHGKSFLQVLVQCLVRTRIPVPSLALQHNMRLADSTSRKAQHKDLLVYLRT